MDKYDLNGDGEIDFQEYCNVGSIIDISKQENMYSAASLTSFSEEIINEQLSSPIGQIFKTT
jgi:hypothetical protein